MEFKVYGKCPISEFLDDRVVYRNLAPTDLRLLPLEAIRNKVGLPPWRLPRKSEPDYARVIVHFLDQAQALDERIGVIQSRDKIQRLIFVGDTRLLDSTAFINICQAGGWPGWAFIGSETSAPLKTEIEEIGPNQSLYLANRWAALKNFDCFLSEFRFPVDERTAVVLDIDKTTLGARGRNASTVDQARVQAVQDTVANLLGSNFDPEAFLNAYDQLNHPEFHPFTADNQDYLAYVCLILESGLWSAERLINQVRSGRIYSFEQFIAEVDGRSKELTPALEAIHQEIYRSVKKGDPTPFKAFRRKEYLATVRRMGYLSDKTPIAKLLSEEILITQEVREQALAWKEKGALLFGLSDKPDEAAVPLPELAKQGYQPIHRVETHAVGALPEESNYLASQFG
jgi:hypothetical protein